MADKTGYIGRNPNDSAVTVARQFFTASGVTTAFTFASGYLTGYLDIYVDGVKKRVADEFTATDGSTFDVLQGGVGAGSTVEAVAYKAFNATTVSGDITGNFDVSGNTTLGGSLDIVGGTTLTNLVVTGISTLGTGTTVGFANTAFNLGGTPNISVDLLSAVDINVSGAATIGGVLTYEDVTNIDSIGIVTARTGVEVTANGLVVNAGVGTFAADVSIADKIVHTGDTNTAIRFPSPDTFAIETTGVERVRVNSDGVVDVNKGLRIVGGGLTVTGISTFKSTIEANVNIQIPDSPDANSGRLKLGSGDDLQIYYNGNNSFVKTAGTSKLILTSNEVDIKNTGNNEFSAKFIQDGAVELYYDNSKKFETSNTGVTVTGALTATSFVGALTGAVTGNSDTATTSTNVTVADESSDTTCFPLFATAATGNLPPKSGTNLTFNSSTGALTATSFVGALTGAVTGNADTATTATTSTNVTVADESSDTTCFPLFATAATGNLPPKSGTNLTFNSSTGALTATSFVGAVTGAVTGNADTATTSTNVTVADESSDTTCFPLFATAATGNLPPKSGTNLTFNSSSGALTATSFSGNISGGTVAGSTGTFTGRMNVTNLASVGDLVFQAKNENADTSRASSLQFSNAGKLILNGNSSNSTTVSIDATNGAATFAQTITAGTETGTGTNVYASGSIQGIVSGTQKWYISPAGVATFTGTVTDSSGNLRITPILGKSSDYTLVVTDTGKTIVRTGGNITVPSSMTAGMIVTIINNANSTTTITAGATLTFTDSTTGNRTLAAYGVATVTYISASSAYITGTGLS